MRLWLLEHPPSLKTTEIPVLFLVLCIELINPIFLPLLAK